jgi:hypothetical protein
MGTDKFLTYIYNVSSVAKLHSRTNQFKSYLKLIITFALEIKQRAFIHYSPLPIHVKPLILLRNGL